MPAPGGSIYSLYDKLRQNRDRDIQYAIMLWDKDPATAQALISPYLGYDWQGRTILSRDMYGHDINTPFTRREAMERMYAREAEDYGMYNANRGYYDRMADYSPEHLKMRDAFEWADREGYTFDESMLPPNIKDKKKTKEDGEVTDKKDNKTNAPEVKKSVPEDDKYSSAKKYLVPSKKDYLESAKKPPLKGKSEFLKKFEEQTREDLETYQRYKNKAKEREQEQREQGTPVKETIVIPDNVVEYYDTEPPYNYVPYYIRG